MVDKHTYIVRCVECGKRLMNDETVHRIKLFNLNDGFDPYFVPTCSDSCAKATVAHQVDLLRSFVTSLETQDPVIETVKSYLSED